MQTWLYMRASMVTVLEGQPVAVRKAVTIGGQVVPGMAVTVNDEGPWNHAAVVDAVTLSGQDQLLLLEVPILGHVAKALVDLQGWEPVTIKELERLFPRRTR